jgi:hypothetical protein
MRAYLRWPEDEGHPHPVEIAFTINGDLFALEHTGIEPFKGHVQMDAQADLLFKPIVDALKNSLGTAAVFELMIPANALRGMKMPKVRSIQQALIAWVNATAPTVPAQRYGDYKKTSVGPATIPGVPFAISLYRFEPALVPGHHFQITHLVQNGEQLREARILEAVDRKFPKLAAWKRNENARTILVLEDNDVQLTNQAIVTETYLPLAVARADRPDETYLVASCMDPWQVWPILIGDKSYFDFARAGDAQDWQIDPARLVPLTKR